MTVSLSGLIRRGFKEAGELPSSVRIFQEAQCRERALKSTCLAELPNLMHRREVPARRQDEILAATIRAYRHGPAAFWGPVLLGLLGPALVRAAARFRAQPPAVDEEDIDQQLVMEALRAAAIMPLPDDCRFVQRRLVFFTMKRVTRWLEREGRRQDSQTPAEATRESRI
jgi:hypothetical protein